MKYCINCLSENPDDAKRCQKCNFEFGQKLNIVTENKKHGKEKSQKNKSNENG